MFCSKVGSKQWGERSIGFGGSLGQLHDKGLMTG